MSTMPQVDGCWANVLDDCEGALDDEHKVAVIVWRPANGVDTRKARERRKVRVEGIRGAAPSYPSTVRKLKDPVLCEGHNRRTSDLDVAAGQFARSLDDFLNTQDARKWCLQMPWRHRSWSVDGKRIERWMLKTIITNAYNHGLPLGGPDAAPGRPTRELAEIVYGLREVERPMGLFALVRVGDRHNFREEFSVHPHTSDSSKNAYYTGAAIVFRTLRFGWQFTRKSRPKNFFAPGNQELDGAITVQPLEHLDDPETATRLTLTW
jgi:hypothetical protein